MAKKNLKNPYDEGSDGYYSWMAKNQPAKHDSLLRASRKEMGITKKQQKQLPNYAMPWKDKSKKTVKKTK